MRRLLATAVVALGLAGSVQAATITNGSFEQGTFSAGAFDEVAAGSTAITGWTVGGGGVDWIGSFWVADDGVRSIDLTRVNPGSLSQNIATVIGQRYAVSFSLAGNPDSGGGPRIKNLDVTINGAGLANFTFDTTGRSNSNMGWVDEIYYFTASSANSLLTFSSNNGEARGPAIDLVSISAVPEASTWAMMIAGFGLAGASLRRRRVVVAA
jgi:choice-of-anchor C domain-containing protein